MSVPDFQSRMRPLPAQLEGGRIHSLGELHDALCLHFQLSPREMREGISGRTLPGQTGQSVAREA